MVVALSVVAAELLGQPAELAEAVAPLGVAGRFLGQEVVAWDTPRVADPVRCVTYRSSVSGHFQSIYTAPTLSPRVSRRAGSLLSNAVTVA